MFWASSASSPWPAPRTGTNPKYHIMQNQSNETPEMPEGAQPDTTGPRETEMPDAQAIDARIESGEGREDAEAAFGEGDETGSSA